MIAMNKGQRCVIMVLLLIVTVTSLEGCANLRRKFIRKSANESKQEVIPVLQPEEYKPVVHSPADEYKTHYVVLRAYYKDLWTSLDRPGDNVKRERYLITEVSVKTKEMVALLKGERKAALQALAARIDAKLPELDKPAGVRRYDLIKSDLVVIERETYNSFKPAAVKEDLSADEAAHP